MVIARSVVRDRFDHQDSARIFSLLTLVLAVAPMIAPTAGGWLVAATNWRWVFGALALFGVGIGIATWWRLDESRSAETEAKARSETPLRAYFDLLRQRRLLGYLLAGALNGATLFAYVASAPDLIINIWGLRPTLFGLVFAIMAVGIIGSSQVNRQLLLRYSADRILGVALVYGIATGGLLVAASLLHAGPWTIFALLFATLSSSGFIGSNALAGALSVDPLRSGSTSGLAGASSFGAGAGAAALSGAFHDGTALPLAVVMLLSLSGAAAAYFGLAHRPEPV